jgi:hypothetical protein
MVLFSFRHIQPNDRRRMGQQSDVGSFVIRDFKAALDDRHGARAMRQHGEHLSLVDRLGMRRADRYLDPHRVRIETERGGDAQRIVP